MSDDLLNEAGARWRADQPPSPGFPRRRRGWRPYAVLVGAALLVGGTVYLTTGTRPTATDEPLPHLGAVVFNGQTVEATGTIETKPGEPVKLCGPGGFLTQSCPSGVDVEGLDQPRHGETVHLRGVWRDGVLTGATRRPIPAPDPIPAEPAVPCPEPAGGWPPAQDDRGALLTYVQAHPEQFRQPRVAQGKVIVISVVKGDLAEVERTLKPLYGGALCVTEQRDKLSIADARTASERALPVMQDPANRIYSGYVDEEKGVYVAEVLYLTADVATKLATTGLPVEVKPWLHPVN